VSYAAATARAVNDEVASNCPRQVRPEHLAKLAVIYIRQSTMEQVRDNSGSTADQRALADRARAWGWPECRVRVIDADLGVSGTSAGQRPGFHEMLDLIERDQVGVVLVRDISRISRDPLDTARFLKVATRAGILLEANGRLVDTTTENLFELFGLHLEGLWWWMDNLNRVRNFRAAKAAKARQGYAVTRAPIGYVRAVRGKWIKDPDVKVQEAVRRVFDLYLQRGSLGKVMGYLREHRLLFPRRVVGEVVWEPLGRSQLANILKNPNYVGDYVFQRVKTAPVADRGRIRTHARPESEWIVTPGHHESYVTREEWDRIQAMSAAQRPAVRPAVGKGDALLQGLLRCGRCERWIHTRYWSRQRGARVPSYVCRPLDRWGKAKHSTSVRAQSVDDAVVEEVLAALAPPTIKEAVAVIRQATAEEASIQRAHARQLQHAEDDAARARRQWEIVDEGHRLVKADLESKYEEALARLQRLRREARCPDATEARVTDADANELVRLSANVRELWNADTTTNEDRKRVLRIVLSEVIVRAISRDALDVELVWIAGLRSPLRIPRQPRPGRHAS
jgi:DNA invertase Pin-like site-specific DNA recombinase